MIVCSACLAGMACKYNGKNNNTDARVIKLVEKGLAVPVCPEMLGGMSVPRVPCEINSGRVVNQIGQDVTDYFTTGAKRALAISEAIHASEAILMPRSPSCGVGRIYDGLFQQRLIEGNGIFAQMLEQHGVSLYTPDTYFKNKEGE